MGASTDVIFFFFNGNALVLNGALPCRANKNMLLLDSRIIFFSQHVFKLV